MESDSFQRLLLRAREAAAVGRRLEAVEILDQLAAASEASEAASVDATAAVAEELARLGAVAQAERVSDALTCRIEEDPNASRDDVLRAALAQATVWLAARRYADVLEVLGRLSPIERAPTGASDMAVR